MLSSSRQAAKRLASKSTLPSSTRNYATNTTGKALNPRREYAPDKQFEFSIGKTPGAFSASFTSWQNIASFSHTFYLIKEVEKLYGPVAEFTVDRDANFDDRYTTRVSIRFKNPESVGQIPEDGTQLRVEVPEPDYQPGGPSLDEITDHTMSNLVNNAESSPSQPKGQLTGRLTRSRENTTRAPFPFPLTHKSHVLAQDYLGWGGFHAKEPIPSSSPMTLEDHPDNPVMRLSMRRWAQLTNTPNPMEINPAKQKSSRPERETSTETPSPATSSTPANGDWVDMSPSSYGLPPADADVSMFAPLDEGPVPVPIPAEPVAAAPMKKQTPTPVSNIPRKIPQNTSVKLPQASAATQTMKPTAKPSSLLQSQDRRKQLENARTKVQQKNLYQPRAEKVQPERPTAATTPTPEQATSTSGESAEENSKSGVMNRFKGFVGGWL